MKLYTKLLTEENPTYIICKRCKEKTPFATKKLVILYDSEGSGIAKWLCPDCFEIVEYASSVDSWISTTSDTKAKKLYYFDKKQE